MHFKLNKSLIVYDDKGKEHTLMPGAILTPTSYDARRKYYAIDSKEYPGTTLMIDRKDVEKVYPDPGYFTMDLKQALSLCAKAMNDALSQALVLEYPQNTLEYTQDRQVVILQCMQFLGCIVAGLQTKERSDA